MIDELRRAFPGVSWRYDGALGYVVGSPKNGGTIVVDRCRGDRIAGFHFRGACTVTSVGTTGVEAVRGLAECGGPVRLLARGWSQVPAPCRYHEAYSAARRNTDFGGMP